MPKPIRLALERTLALVLSLLIPATGRRRRRHGISGPAPASPRTLSGLRLIIRRTTPPRLLPVRARTGIPGILDDPGPLVRPYLLVHERRQQQQARRTALVLALDGIDVGPWMIHGHRIGTPVGATAGAAA